MGVLLDSPFFLRRRGASRLTWDGVVVSRSPGDASGGGVLLGASLGVAGADVMVALRTASRGVLCAWGLHLGRGQECLGGIHRVSVTRASCVGSSGKHFFGGYGEAIASVRSCTPSGGWAGGLEKSSEGRPRVCQSRCVGSQPLSWGCSGASADGMGTFSAGRRWIWQEESLKGDSFWRSLLKGNN